ncbi:hypothetical protein RSAG8_03942, partial [Rhizoctonia solani AG-8 WAC10335]
MLTTRGSPRYNHYLLVEVVTSQLMLTPSNDDQLNNPIACSACSFPRSRRTPTSPAVYA